MTKENFKQIQSYLEFMQKNKIPYTLRFSNGITVDTFYTTPDIFRVRTDDMVVLYKGYLPTMSFIHALHPDEDLDCYGIIPTMYDIFNDSEIDWVTVS
jgi:uncharacterized protein with ParB-like and HNH nuclease domain